jgi:hypothetical protein
MATSNFTKHHRVLAADRDLARRAVHMALPLLENAMRDASFGDSGFLHVVVLNPAMAPGAARFEEAILYEHSLGDRKRWDADYAAFARDKALTSWVEQRDNDAGAAYLDGIVVAASGAFPAFDHAYSTAIAACLRGLARHEDRARQ